MHALTMNAIPMEITTEIHQQIAIALSHEGPRSNARTVLIPPEMRVNNVTYAASHRPSESSPRSSRD